MRNGANIKQFVHSMQQARRASEEAWQLLEENADLRLVANSLYRVYACCIIALLHTVGADPVLPDAAYALFEKLFRGTGIIDDAFFPLARRVIELAPQQHSASHRPMGRAKVVEKLREAQAFSFAVSAAAEEGLVDGPAAGERAPNRVFNA